MQEGLQNLRFFYYLFILFFKTELRIYFIKFLQLYFINPRCYFIGGYFIGCYF